MSVRRPARRAPAPRGFPIAGADADGVDAEALAVRSPPQLADASAGAGGRAPAWGRPATIGPAAVAGAAQHPALGVERLSASTAVRARVRMTAAHAAGSS